MEISNRKLFSRGMIAIGIAVVVSGVPGAIFAADQPKAAAAATAVDQDAELSVREQEIRKKNFADQDARIEAARKQNFDAARKEFRAVIADLGNPAHNYGSLGKERRLLFLSELETLKMQQGRDLLHRAKVAALDELYPNAIQLAAEASEVSKPEKSDDGTQLDSPLLSEVETFTTYCQTRQKAKDFRNETNINTINPQHQGNKEKIAQLLREARTYLKAARYEDAISKIEDIYLIDPYHRDAIQLMNDVYQRFYRAGLNRKKADTEGILASSAWQWVEPVFPVSIQSGPKTAERKTPTAHGTLAKMERIIFPRIDFEDRDVKSVLTFLNERSRLYDPDKEGVSIMFGFDNRTAEQLGRVTMSLSQIPMSEVLRYVCKDTGLKYRVDPNGVVVGPNVDEMRTQYFQVRGDLITSITGDEVPAEDGGAPAERRPPPAGLTGGGEGGGGGEGAVDPFARQSSVQPPTNTELGLMHYFRERGVPFGEGSSITYYKRAGKLSVRNTTENLRRFDELLRQLDGIQNPLVMVEIKGIEIAENSMQELGFDWGLNMISSEMDSGGKLYSGADSGWAFGQGISKTPNVRTSGSSSAIINNLNIFPALFGSQHIFGSDQPLNIYLTINALNQNRRTETLSAPKVMTSSGHMASVKMAKSYWFPDEWETYEIKDEDNGITIVPPKPSFKEHNNIGISFNVTPVVNPDNYTITLDVNPIIKTYLGKDETSIEVELEESYIREVPMLDPAGNVIPDKYQNEVVRIVDKLRFTVWMPKISSRELRVNVTVYDGETIVLGGMVDNLTTSIKDKWPILGDLPFVGRFFQTQSEESYRTNLLIFVTTRLVNNDGIPIRRNLRTGAPDFRR